ncbi:Rossmann fold domain-containing protein [Erythrobacter rubeus]|uniref:Short chain dehydrogenase-like proteobacteria domain-containing protein n=1 Tax=Erythrobacter rubeus TaxID=2760803 RepID=A0ABR8KRU2_9SPHN|nr:hypothetical protein [Erythrobacter rubeus]MBD2842295.1 hypothetical protein [Erythrobacter rubeus]
MQQVLTIVALPKSGIEANAVFFAKYFDTARARLTGAGVTSLVIVMPPAGSDHDDWRRSLARDLARDHAPQRVNIVGGAGDHIEPTLAYLGNAPGVTGQYIALHE